MKECIWISHWGNRPKRGRFCAGMSIYYSYRIDQSNEQLFNLRIANMSSWDDLTEALAIYLGVWIVQ